MKGVTEGNDLCGNGLSSSEMLFFPTCTITSEIGRTMPRLIVRSVAGRHDRSYERSQDVTIDPVLVAECHD